METNETKIFFDAALEMALRAEIDHELAQTPSPAELKRKYPDTSRWDARLYAVLKRQTRHSHMRKRLVMVLLVTALLAAGGFCRKRRTAPRNLHSRHTMAADRNAPDL